MAQTTFEVIVVGLGAHGSATLYHLARRHGARVLGVDAHTPPHERGSSHGHTRIYRQAYFEAPAYVPLAVRALELWHELSAVTRQELFVRTGALTIGPAAGALVAGVLRSAREHGLAHEVIDGADVARRFPVFRAATDTVAVLEPEGGVLFPEACVHAHLTLARSAGAVVHTAEALERFTHTPGGVEVTTTTGRYAARRVVLATGAWTPQVTGLGRALTVTRESVHWFTSAGREASAGECPVAMIDQGDEPMLYTIPDFGHGFKAGLHHAGAPADPDRPGDDDLTAARDAVARAVARAAPGGAGAARGSMPCFYTSTPDGHFAVGPLPSVPAVILMSACSGHGFKFASALGEAVARMADDEESGLPAGMFDPARL